MSETQASERTNLENFNFYFREFVQRVMQVFPDFKTKLAINYGNMLKNENCDGDKYARNFMKKMRPFSKQIAGEDESMFNRSVIVLDGMDFGKIWNNESMTQNSKKAVWQYLQLLYVVGRTVVSDKDDIQQMLRDFKLRPKAEKVVEQRQHKTTQLVPVEDSEEEKRKRRSINSSQTYTNSGKTQQNPAAGLMSMMSNMMSNSGGDNEDGGGMSGLAGMLGNLPGMGSFMEMAEEIQQEFAGEDFMDDDGPPDLSKFMAKMQEPEMGTKLASISQKIAAKMQGSVENGEMNLESLQAQAQQAMSTMGINPEMVRNMAENMGVRNPTGAANRHASDNRSQAARERLRRKYEEKQKAKSQDQPDTSE